MKLFEVSASASICYFVVSRHGLVNHRLNWLSGVIFFFCGFFGIYCLMTFENIVFGSFLKFLSFAIFFNYFLIDLLLILCKDWSQPVYCKI